MPCFGWWPTLPIPKQTSTTDLSGTLQWKESNFNTGQVQEFNLMVQQQFGANVLTVGGVGELGRHVTYTGTANLPLPNGPYTNDATAGPPAPAAYTTVADLPNVQAISRLSVRGTQNYYALQAVFARRITKGLEFNANYTWAHDLTNGFVGTGFGGVGALVTNNPHYDYGNAGVDMRHRLATTATYALPFFNDARGAAKTLLGGWTANMIMFWQTGQGFTVSDSWTNASGAAQINLPSVTSDRPNVAAGQAYKTGAVGTPGAASWLNGNAFAVQPAGTAGNEHNLQQFGPHTRRADMSLFKNFALPEKMTLQFRAEVYNISNTPNFSNPASAISSWNPGPEHDATHPIANPTHDPTLTAVGLLPGDMPVPYGGALASGNAGGASTFGEITSTAKNVNPRQFQFALKLLF